MSPDPYLSAGGDYTPLFHVPERQGQIPDRGPNNNQRQMQGRGGGEGQHNNPNPPSQRLMTREEQAKRKAECIVEHYRNWVTGRMMRCALSFAGLFVGFVILLAIWRGTLSVLGFESDKEIKNTEGALGRIGYCLMLIIFIGFTSVFQGIVMTQFVPNKSYPLSNRQKFMKKIGSPDFSIVLAAGVLGILSWILLLCLLQFVGVCSDGYKNAVNGDSCRRVSIFSSVMVMCGEYNDIMTIIAIATFIMVVKQQSYQGFLIALPNVDMAEMDRALAQVLRAWKDSKIWIVRFLMVGYGIFVFSGTVSMFSMDHSKKSCSVLKFFNFSLYFHYTIFLTFVLFLTRLSWRIAEFHLAASLQLPLESRFGPAANYVVLSDALTCNIRHMKLLGFYQFAQMTCTPRTVESFRQFTSLSRNQAGGIPEIWNGVCRAVLGECEKTTENLRSLMKQCKQRRNPSAADPLSSNPMGARLLENIAVNEQGETDEQVRRRNMRNLNAARGPPQQIVALDINPAQFSLYFNFNLAWKYLKNLIGKLITTKIKKRADDRIKSFLLDEDWVMEISNCVAEYQVLIWGVNGLTEIVCASLTHDPHGVVQGDVQTILRVFLRLYDAVLESKKVNVQDEELLHSVPQIKENDAILSVLAKCLFFSLKRIHQGFFGFYQILNFSPEMHQRLMAFDT